MSPTTLICKQICFCERLTWNPAESLVCDVSRQLNVLHQATSCSSCYDIRDIAIHAYTCTKLAKYTHLQTDLGHLLTSVWFKRKNPPITTGCHFLHSTAAVTVTSRSSLVPIIQMAGQTTILN
ncbi:hypothetical protein CSKR_110728 [Clonorchis sinensis]|uniref:Uncharacterized protein n=1 Tax=Clonorchis sinensis TaxID=79923 RepID=A0A3R7GYP5_CLOSI|nr:hypothetical protein CSKR_110728 [Clonorchis sinensis]